MKVPLLIDFDGVIKLGSGIAPDARYFFREVAERKIPSIILSNSTLYSGSHIINYLKDNDAYFGIPCLTTVDAATSYLNERNVKCALFCSENIKHNFYQFEDKNPEAVLIGDLQENWNYENLNKIFRLVLNGAEIIALHKNKFWKPKDELCLDAGAFITGIEYASGKKATVIGKPSPLFFKIGLKSLNFSPDVPFYMLGDDVENDIAGAQSIGGKGILIYTGKTTYPVSNKEYEYFPVYEVMNLTETVNLLNVLYA